MMRARGAAFKSATRWGEGRAGVNPSTGGGLNRTSDLVIAVAIAVAIAV